MRAFVIVGGRAHADGDVRLDDLPGTSGRLDVLARCVRAALCVSHGIRRDARVYLLLAGGKAPCAVRLDGALAKFVRPDERALATMLLKAVARADATRAEFVPQRHGVAVAFAGLEAVLADLEGEPLYILEEGASELCTTQLPGGGGTFVVGDHAGFSDAVRAQLERAGARPVAVGPVSLHSEDVVTLVNAELDRALYAARKP